MDTKTIDVVVRVDHVDLNSVETGEILAAQFPTLIWEELDGLTTLTDSFPEDSAVAKAVELCRKLEAAITGAKAVGVHRDMVNTTDISLRVNLSREAVRKWTAREDFPSPIEVVGSDNMKLWAWVQIVEWLRDVRGIELDDNPMSLRDMTHLENCLMRNPDHTTMQWQSAQRHMTTKFESHNAHRVQQPVLVGSAGRGHVGTVAPRTVLVGASGTFKRDC